MQCNIDSNGKSLRLISGLISTLIGTILLIIILTGFLVGWGWWLAAILILAMGLFQIYEGWAGWCVVRAMGFKTPI